MAAQILSIRNMREKPEDISITGNGVLMTGDEMAEEIVDSIGLLHK
jgi:hypothetical protein